MDYWNAINMTGLIVQKSVGLVPGVGGLLSGLVGVLWPYEQDDLWGQIKEKVEELLKLALDKVVWQDVSNKLAGLEDAVNDYLSLVQESPDDVVTIRTKWETLATAFQTDLPAFQSKNSELLLLPLFAQFGNLYLALLRDGVLFGAGWGWPPATVAQRQQTLTASIAAFGSYAQTWYQNGLDGVRSRTGTDNHACQPFRDVNRYQREMTLTVLDMRSAWPYLDPKTYPDPVAFYIGREIYSDPVGTWDNSGPITLAGAPQQPICHVAVWKANFVDAVQVSYPPNGGPGGQTITAPMGKPSAGNTDGGTFPVLGKNPIVTARGNAGDILNGMAFTMKDGTTRGVFGGGSTGQSVDGTKQYGNPYSFGYVGEIVSRIHINGTSNHYGCADSAVFGFTFDPNPTTNPAALQVLYVNAPTPVTIEALAPDDRRELARRAEKEGWEAQRRAVRERRRAHRRRAGGRHRP